MKFETAVGVIRQFILGDLKGSMPPQAAPWLERAADVAANAVACIVMQRFVQRIGEGREATAEAIEDALDAAKARGAEPDVDGCSCRSAIEITTANDAGRRYQCVGCGREWLVAPEAGQDADGALVTLANCPPGPFEFQGSLGFKTEYGAMRPIIGRGRLWTWPEAYCMETGEAFWGGAKTDSERAALMVRPVSIASVKAIPADEMVEF